MQQYFSEVPLIIGEIYRFTSSQEHHVKNVMRMHDEVIRLVYEGKAFFARVEKDTNGYYALVLEEDLSEKELPCEVTLAMALIRKDPLELVLQKATELGVTRIVLFESSRCAVHAKKDRLAHQISRWNTILKEAAEQCKRNRIPELIGIIPFSELNQYKQSQNFLAYEEARMTCPFLSEEIQKENSQMIVIGPEGGFSKEEVMELENNGFQTITLGSRILRAETAAIYACAIISEIMGRH